MSGDLNSGFELFPFHPVGKFSRTETKYLLFLPPMYSAILTATLKAWLLSLTSLRPPIFQYVVFVLSLVTFVLAQLPSGVLAARFSLSLGVSGTALLPFAVACCTSSDLSNRVLKWWRGKHDFPPLKLWVLFDCSQQPIWKKFTRKKKGSLVH